MMKRITFAAFVLALVAGVVAAQGPANEVYQELVQQGLALPGGPTVKLPAPLCAPGQVPADPAGVLRKAAAAGNRDLELFLDPRVVAPSLEISSILEKPDGERWGQQVDLWFVAYGTLDAVVDTDFMKQMFSPRKAARGKAAGETAELSDADLRARGIRPVAGPDVKEWFETFTMPLFEKVEVRGVMHTVRTTSPGSVLYAQKLDDRFKGDKEFPNRWHAIPRGAAEGEVGRPQRYSGLGGYVLVTALAEPKDALLVEMHFVLHEPTDWFGGPNLLRSKLPILIRDNVKTFRGKLR